VAISNRRLIKADATGVTFTFKDYRINGPGRYKTMTLEPPRASAITLRAHGGTNVCQLEPLSGCGPPNLYQHP